MKNTPEAEQRTQRAIKRALSSIAQLLLCTGNQWFGGWPNRTCSTTHVVAGHLCTTVALRHNTCNEDAAGTRESKLKHNNRHQLAAILAAPSAFNRCNDQGATTE